MIVVISSVTVVTLLGWLLRPQPVTRRPDSCRRSRRWPGIAVAGIAVAGIAAVFSPVLGATAMMGVATWRRWSGTRRRARSSGQVSSSFPDVLDLLVLSIRAGYVPAQALVEITPFVPRSLQPSWIAVAEAMDRGERFADALGELQAHLGPIAQPLVDSLSAADRYGLPLAPVLERLASEARQQRRRETDATARELPVRLAVPLVLCTLPSFVLLAIVPLLLGALSSLHT